MKLKKKGEVLDIKSKSDLEKFKSLGKRNPNKIDKAKKAETKPKRKYTRKKKVDKTKEGE